MSLNYAGRAWSVITNTPGSAGTSFVVTTGQGARFLTGAQTTAARVSGVNDPGSVEWVQITNRSTDTFTVTRNYDAGGALNITPGVYSLDIVEDLAPWNALAYNAGFFSSAGGGSFDVGSGDVVGHAWRRIGFTVWYRIRLAGFGITGTVTELRVLFSTAGLPSGPKYTEGPYPVMVFNNSTSVVIACYAVWVAGGTYVSIFKLDGSAFAASTDNSYLGFNFPIEVA